MRSAVSQEVLKFKWWDTTFKINCINSSEWIVYFWNERRRKNWSKKQTSPETSVNALEAPRIIFSFLVVLSVTVFARRKSGQQFQGIVYFSFYINFQALSFFHYFLFIFGWITPAPPRSPSLTFSLLGKWTKVQSIPGSYNKDWLKIRYQC